MAKRNLTDEEKNINEKALQKHQKLVKDLTENLEYNKALLAKQKYLRDFDDKWRVYLRERKDREDDNVLKQIQKELENSNEHIKLLTSQLKTGVEIKKVTGIS